MAIRHGNRSYYQLLLDLHRAALVEELAAKHSVRPTAWIRDAVYRQLERELPASVYNAAAAADAAEWAQSVKRRVEGRTKKTQKPEGGVA